jgi:hypothetical protein
MASKSKRRRQEKRPDRFWHAHRRLIALTGLLCGLSVYVGFAEFRTPTRLQLAKQVQVEFKLDLEATLTDDRYPVPVRRRLAEMAARNISHQLVLDISTKPMDLPSYTLAWSDLVSKPPRIGIQMQRFLELRQAQNADLFRSTIMIAMYHETVHMEKWPLPRALTDAALLDEEVRAYGRTSLEMVRPLEFNGVWIMNDYTRLDGVLRSCWDNLNCPAFRAAVKDYAGL